MRFRDRLLKTAWAAFVALGISFSFMLVLSFTDIPYYAYRNLSLEGDTLSQNPDYIVVLGGSGMPSPDGLMRMYCANEYAQVFKNSKIIIALPYSIGDSLYQLRLMAKELILRGIDSARISFEPLGHNTHSQAENIAKILGPIGIQKPMLIVSTPEHLFRAIHCFRKLGFKQVGSAPAFDNPVSPNQLKDKEIPKESQVRNLNLRYNMWSYMNYELLTLREYFAIVYYKLKGWI